MLCAMPIPPHFAHSGHRSFLDTIGNHLSETFLEQLLECGDALAELQTPDSVRGTERQEDGQGKRYETYLVELIIASD
jgi:hypothetical protein